MTTLVNQIKKVEELLSDTADRSQPVYKAPAGWCEKGYPAIAKLADEQAAIFWPWEEPDVPSDVHDILTVATDADREAIKYALKLFTLYELRAGDDYWMVRIAKRFPRTEFKRMATMNAAVEFNSHGGFYNRINELLYADTEEFYESYKEDPILVERMSFIEDITRSSDDLISTGAFSFVEGAILYVNFAYFKHFQVEKYGKNLIRNICRGINQSVSDENIHALGSAATARILINERGIKGEKLIAFQDLMISAAQKVYEHESHIIDNLFSFGEIEKGDFTPDAMRDFTAHRINLCLSNLGISRGHLEEKGTEIKDWFYKNINSVVLHDFFTGHSSEYQGNIDREKFKSAWMSSQ